MHNGAQVWTTRIVIGKPSTATPLLSETMKSVTVNPTWTVPQSIVRNEYLPALAQDPTVLERMGLRVSHHGDGVTITQPPGAGNALGRVRFNINNRFSVFQHDTPDKHLFPHEVRAYRQREAEFTAPVLRDLERHLYLYTLDEHWRDHLYELDAPLFGFGTVTDVARSLAQAIVRDGEGATKFVTVRVERGRTEAECRKVAYAIAHSPLVKTAFFAGDPNLGRILAAIGNAGIGSLDSARVDLYLDEVLVAKGGGRYAGYLEEQGVAAMAKPEFTVRALLNRGKAAATVWTCDLSFDYVKINAEYRS